MGLYIYKVNWINQWIFWYILICIIIFLTPPPIHSRYLLKMHPNLSPSSLVIPAIIFLLSHQFSNFVCSDEFHYSNCNSPVECGGLGKIEYPFWVNGAQPDYCGHPRFKLDCLRGDFPTIQIMHRDYLVMDIDYDTQILKMATFYEFFCPEFDIAMDSTLFSYTSDVEIATVFYDCSSTDPHPGSYNFSCVINSFPNDAYLVTNTSAASEFASECNFSASVPVVVPKSADGVKEILSSVFKVNWTVNKTECDECVGSGGRCGYNSTLDQPCCFCPDNPYRNKCPNLRSSMYPSSLSMLFSLWSTYLQQSMLFHFLFLVPSLFLPPFTFCSRKVWNPRHIQQPLSQLL